MRPLGLVAEVRGALLIAEARHGADHRQEGELSVVPDPGAGLVRLLDAAELLSRVGVLPAVAHLPRLGRPAIHPPGAGDDGVGIARTELVAAQRPRERIHELGIGGARYRGRLSQRLEGEA